MMKKYLHKEHFSNYSQDERKEHFSTLLSGSTKNTSVNYSQDEHKEHFSTFVNYSQDECKEHFSKLLS